MRTFSNKVVLIKGAGRGLGRGLAVGFSDRGAFIAATDTSPLHLEETAEIIHKQGSRCLAFDHDMSKKHFVQGTIEDIQETLGTPDILVNAHFLGPKGSLETLGDWDWQYALDVNLTGSLYTIQAFLRIAGNTQGKKSIITILPSSSHPALEVVKFGLLGLTDTAAQAGSERNVSVNAVSARGFSPDEVRQEVYKLCSQAGMITGHLITPLGPMRLKDLPL